MPFQYEPEYAQAIEPLLPLLSKRTSLVIEDIAASREVRERSIAHFFSKLPDPQDIEQRVYQIDAPDGYKVPVRAFTKRRTTGPEHVPGPAIIHYHGGGLILGSAELHAKPLSLLVSETGIPIFSVDYRLAPEHTGSTPVEDCYSALVWLQQNADAQGIDPARIAVFGESAGGGLAAGVTLLARDRDLNPPIAKQILVYPMLDDRTRIPNEGMEHLAFWKTEDNATAWDAILGGEAASSYVAPARAESLAGLPPAYIDVGELDIFRDENIAYATRLLAANVSTELHVYPGLPHAFEMVAPFISGTTIALRNRVKAMLSF